MMNAKDMAELGTLLMEDPDPATVWERHFANRGEVQTRQAVRIPVDAPTESAQMAKLLRRNEELSFAVARAVNYLDLGDANSARAVLLEQIGRGK